MIVKVNSKDDTFSASGKIQVFREAQNGHDKKTTIFLVAFPFLSGKFGKQSLRSLLEIYFFFGITVFLYRTKFLSII
jgi:hypothetical protein